MNARAVANLISRTVTEIEAAAHRKGVLLDLDAYKAGATDIITARGHFAGVRTVCLLCTSTGRRWGELSDQTKFDSNNGDHRGELWFWDMTEFFFRIYVRSDFTIPHFSWADDFHKEMCRRTLYDSRHPDIGLKYLVTEREILGEKKMVGPTLVPNPFYGETYDTVLTSLFGENHGFDIPESRRSGTRLMRDRAHG